MKAVGLHGPPWPKQNLTRRSLMALSRTRTQRLAAVLDFGLHTTVLIMYQLPDGGNAYVDLAHTTWPVLWTIEAYDGFLSNAIQLEFWASEPGEALLVLTDGPRAGLFVVDLKARRFVAPVAPHGALEFPLRCAAAGSTVAVSCGPRHAVCCGEPTFAGHVRLYSRVDCEWIHVRTISHGKLGPGMNRKNFSPGALRMTADGRTLAVVDHHGGDALLFTSNGDFVATLCGPVETPLDIEECRGGWLLLQGSTRTVQFLGGSQYLWDTLGNPDTGLVPGCIETLTMVPGVGLFITDRSRDRQYHVFLDTPDFYGCKVDYPPQRGLGFELDTLVVPGSRPLTLERGTAFAVCKGINMRVAATVKSHPDGCTHRFALTLFNMHTPIQTAASGCFLDRVGTWCFDVPRRVGVINATFWEPDSDGHVPPPAPRRSKGQCLYYGLRPGPAAAGRPTPSWFCRRHLSGYRA